MKFLIAAIAILSFCGSVFSQIYLPTHPTTYGERKNRESIDSSFLYPTGCGDPVMRSGLRSQSMIYFDSCNHKFWFYDPKRHSWDNLTRSLMSAGSGYKVLSADTAIKSLLASQGVTLDSATTGQIGIKWGGTLTGNVNIDNNGQTELFSNLDGTSTLKIGSAFNGIATYAMLLEGSSTGSSTGFSIKNTNSFSGSVASFVAVNNLNEQMVLQMPSSGFSVAGGRAKTGLIHCNCDSGLQLSTVRIGSSIYFGNGIVASSLGANQNVMTLSGKTGNMLLQNGVWNPIDAGMNKKLQVFGSQVTRDTIFNPGNKYNGSSTALTMVTFDTLTGAYHHRSLSAFPYIADADFLSGATTSQTSVSAITVGASDASYEIGGSITVTAVVVGTVTMTCDYTDETNAARTATFFGEGLTTAALSGTGVSAFPAIDIRCKAGTTITTKTTVTGTITYNVATRILFLF